MKVLDNGSASNAWSPTDSGQESSATSGLTAVLLSHTSARSWEYSARSDDDLANDAVICRWFLSANEGKPPSGRWVVQSCD